MRIANIKKIIAFGLLFMVAGANMTFAERPMMVDDPEVSPLGIFTLEAGYEFQALRGSERPARYVNLTETALIYGFAPGFEASLTFPVGFVAYERGHTDSSEFGIGDLSPAVKRVWHDDDGRFGTGIEVGLDFPLENEPLFGSESLGLNVNTMGDVNMGSWILRGALGYSGEVRHYGDGAIETGIALRTDIHPVHFAFAEIFTEISVKESVDPMPLNLMIGGGYGIGDAVLDAALTLGLTDSDVFPRIGFIVGVTVEL